MINMTHVTKYTHMRVCIGKCCFFKDFYSFRGGSGGVLAGRYTDTNFEQHANTCENVGVLDRLSYMMTWNMVPNSLCITQSYYARTASGGGKEGGILYLNKIYDTGFGVYTPKDQRSRRTTNY